VLLCYTCVIQYVMNSQNTKSYVNIVILWFLIISFITLCNEYAMIDVVDNTVTVSGASSSFIF